MDTFDSLDPLALDIGKCKKCHKTFQIDSSNKSTTLEKLCKNCSTIIPQNLDDIHKKKPMEKVTIECKKCSAKFGHYWQLTNHTTRNRLEKPYKCNDCMTVLTLKCELKPHKRLHADKKNEHVFKCKKCPETFPYLYALHAHRLVHMKNVSQSKKSPNEINKIEKYSTESDKKITRKFSCPQCLKNNLCFATVLLHNDYHQNKIYFRCKYCHQKFKNYARFNSHVKLHFNIKPFKCEICPEDFVTMNLLKLHMQTHSNNKTFTCNLCHARLLSYERLKRHKLIHFRNNKSFPIQYTLKRHKKIHRLNKNTRNTYKITHSTSNDASDSKHIDKSVSHDQLKCDESTHAPKCACYVCEKLHLLQNMFIKHDKKYKKLNKYTCKLCSEEFVGISQVYLHKFMHSMKDNCYETCTSRKDEIKSDQHEEERSNLERHKQTRCVELFVCSQCPKQLSSYDQLELHESSHSNAFKCDVCRKSFAFELTLESHKLKHIIVKGEFKCEKCFEAFRNVLELQTHRRTHSELEPLRKCKTCRRYFTSAKVLKEHELTHASNNKNLFKCNLCINNKFFGIRSHLSRHLLVHMTEKTYTCDVCFKIFIKIHSLNTHMRTHERRFIKNKLRKQINVFNINKRDEQTHTRTKNYKCEVCSKGFLVNSELELHMRTHADKKSSLKNLEKQQNSCVTNKFIRCNECFETFTDKTEFELHKSTHQDSYMCDYCSTDFEQLSNYKIHLLSHSQGKNMES